MKQMKTITVMIVIFVAAVLIAVVDRIPQFGTNASLLFILIFWAAVIEGCIALVAASDLSKGKWIAPLKGELLSVYPLLILICAFFLILEPQLNIIYPRIGVQGVWLNKWFYMIRNLVVLLVTYFVAAKFAVESLKESRKKNLYAVLYLLAFVLSQSLIAFDWVMPLEYPWYSTLFGGYFFIEAVDAGIAMSGIFCFLLLKKSSRENLSTLKQALQDTATMMFGFTLLWAGLFYAQYLVIWYGNIPEETVFLFQRISTSPLREMSYFVLITLFIAPFIILLSRRVKSNPLVVLIVSLLILSGLFIERLVFIAPKVPINPLVLILQFLLMTFLFIVVVTHKKPVLEYSG